MSEQNEDGQEEHILDPYGEMVLLLDADPQTLREPIKTQDNESIRRIINILEDQINNTPLEGNEDLINRHLQVWFFCIRQLEDEPAHKDDYENFKLDFTEWEYQQFY